MSEKQLHLPWSQEFAYHIWTLILRGLMTWWMSKSLGGILNSYCLMLSEKCINMIITSILMRGKVSEKTTAGSSLSCVIYAHVCFCTLSINMTAKTTHISATITSFYSLIQSEMWKHWFFFLTSCSAFLLAWFTLRTTRGTYEIFSNGIPNIHVKRVELGNITLSQETGNKLKLCHTNLFGTFLSPTSVFSSYCSTASLSLSLIIWVTGDINLYQHYQNAIIIQTKFINENLIQNLYLLTLMSCNLLIG